MLTLDDYEKAAKRVLPMASYNYIRSGADTERALRANRRAFSRYEIWYRVLVDVAACTPETTILGTKVAFPVLVAPMALHRLAHPDGELASSRAATRAGTVFTLSTSSTVCLEEVAAASVGPRWFQLYVHKDRGLTRSLVERAEAAGYLALVLTVDVPVLGRRLADERFGFTLPKGVTLANLEGRVSISEGSEGSFLSAYVLTQQDASVTWDDIEWLRSITTLPLVLKGIVRPDDASRAAEMGVAGVIVSNHGGRQMDAAPPAIDALSEVTEAIAGRCELMMDGGVRSGNDVLKALALGARAVLVGRPILWGLAVDGEAGALGVLEILKDELQRAMALAGCPDLASISGDLIRRARSPRSG